MANTDIVRYAGDTYPTAVRIKINGVPVDLSAGWLVDLRYKDGNTIHIIDCAIEDAYNGLVHVYPHARLESDTTRLTNDQFVTDKEAAADATLTSNQVFTSGPAEYVYRVVRHKKYTNYEETMTHLSGVIKILEAI